MTGTLELLKSASMKLSDDDLSVGTSFEARIYKRTSEFPPSYELDLQLWLKFDQINPNNNTGLIFGDADNNPFFIRFWNQADWSNFIKAAEQQAESWNNKFWLKPPESVIEFDVYDMNKGLWVRPYIKCTLSVYFGDVPGSFGRKTPHSVIRVANVDPNKYLNPGTFRSHSLLYSDDDTTPKLFTVPDNLNANHNFTQPTITHEIGHALGLRHIGVLRKTAFCNFAQMVDVNGQNASYCYGYGEPAAVAENIMGYGQSFTVDNARPWIWAATRMLGPGFWTPLVSYPGNRFPAAERNRVR